MTFKIRYIFIAILLFILACWFWPKIIIVHYDNPEEPIEITLSQYDDTVTEKVLEKGTKFFYFKGGATRWTRGVSIIYWKHINSKSGEAFSIERGKKFPSADDALNFNICRGNIHINKDGSVQKAEWTYPVFMNLCL